MKELFEKLQARKLTANQLYILFVVKEQTGDMSSMSEGLSLAHDLAALQRAGMLTEDSKITEAGFALVNELGELFKAPKKKGAPLLPEAVEQIKQYNLLFPQIKIPTSNKPARSNQRDVESNFIWFLKNYNYSWETIFKATEAYVNEFEKKGYKYMRTSEYFVRKQDPDKSFKSELANYCSIVESGGLSSNTTHFSEKVV